MHASIWNCFKRHAQLAQRLMDDIIDLEMEKIDLILSKIKTDPQVDEVKSAEYHLWEKIKKKSCQGRRTGVGITAEGDMIAAMGLRYGTQEATDFSVDIHRTLALNAYRSSVTWHRSVVRLRYTMLSVRRRIRLSSSEGS